MTAGGPTAPVHRIHITYNTRGFSWIYTLWSGVRVNANKNDTY